MRRTLSGALALFAALPLLACSGDAPEPDAAGGAMDAPPSPAGQVWAWQATTGANPMQIDPSAAYTVEFREDGGYFVQADCNSARGGYSVDGSNLEMRPGPMTLAACPEGSHSAMYLDMLSLVTSFERSEGLLTLKLSDGGTMDFIPLPTSASLGGSEVLAGEWTVTGYNNGRGGVTTLVASTEINAVFAADGTVAGSAGCNNFNGPVSVDGAGVSIGPLAATMKMCAAEGVMEQESQFLAAMQNSTRWEIRGDRLELRNDDGALQVSLKR
ncbi:MAG: META domain-containing protein [marine benthic group bacterium]|nr:META domain-containing protein [Gemmatimonadota bacterium]